MIFRPFHVGLLPGGVTKTPLPLFSFDQVSVSSPKYLHADSFQIYTCSSDSLGLETCAYTAHFIPTLDFYWAPETPHD